MLSGIGIGIIISLVVIAIVARSLLRSFWNKF